MPGFPPLFAPTDWWRGEDVPRRDFLRFRLRGGTVLSLPVAGGASALKNHDPASWTLAPNSAVQARKIDHTVETLYGNTPYYRLLGPALSLGRRIRRDSSLPPVGSLLTELYTLCAEVLTGEQASCVTAFGSRTDRFRSMAEYAAGLGDAQREAIGEECRRINDATDPSLSILDPLFRFGPRAIFLLLPTF